MVVERGKKRDIVRESAMVDRTTGEVVGIIWTSKIPKSDRVQNSDFLKTSRSTN